MQWSCPHCGISLAVPEDTLGTGWSFSRCYKCGGFALIRKAEINIIKVDKAPPGERIILPEGSSNPATGLMSETATKRYAKHTQAKPKQNPETVSAPSTPVTSPPASAQQQFVSLEGSNFGLPEPLAEVPPGRARAQLIPLGISVTAAVTVASGIYLYIQGQFLWQKARESATDSPRLHAPRHPAPAEAPLSKVREVVPPPSILPSEIVSQNTHASGPQNPARSLLTDQVQQSSMAPLKSPSSGESALSQLPIVTLRTTKANLHSGPGIKFPIVGVATFNNRYLVNGWNDRWFKLLRQDASGIQTLGWIRNDFVQIHTSPSSGVTPPKVNPLR